MDSELIYNKYICANCGAVVLANTIEEIIENEKRCISCLSLSRNIAHKNILKNPRRPRPKKETRPKTFIELEKKKKEDEAKWGHLRNTKESK